VLWLSGPRRASRRVRGRSSATRCRTRKSPPVRRVVEDHRRAPMPPFTLLRASGRTSRRRVRGAARRGEGPRQEAGIQLPRRRFGSGTPKVQRRSCGTVQQAGTTRARAHPGVSRSPNGRVRHLSTSGPPRRSTLRRSTTRTAQGFRRVRNAAGSAQSNLQRARTKRCAKTCASAPSAISRAPVARSWHGTCAEVDREPAVSRP